MNHLLFEKEALRENAKTLKVLYVENHAGTRLQFSRLLKHYFGELFVTTYPDNAIKIFESGYFDLIITGTNLPDMDTSVVCKKIKNIAPKKPIIIISKDKNPDKIIELVNIGISGYILTPLNEKEIIHILSKVVLDITDMQMIYNFQDTITSELSENAEKHKEVYHELITDEDFEKYADSIVDEGTQNLRDEENLELMLTKFEKISAEDFFNNYPIDLHATGDKLLSLNEDIDMHINKFILSPSHKNATVVADEFKKFSELLHPVAIFSNMAFSVNKLSTVFDTIDYTKSYKQHYDIILAISDELMGWVNAVFIHRDAEDIHYLDKSFLANALMLEDLFRRDTSTEI